MDYEMQLNKLHSKTKTFYRPTAIGAIGSLPNSNNESQQKATQPLSPNPPLSPSHALLTFDEWNTQPLPDYPESDSEMIFPKKQATVIRFTSQKHQRVSNDVVRPTWPLITTADKLDFNDCLDPLDSHTSDVKDTYLLRSTANKEKRFLSRQNSNVRRRPTKQLSVNIDVLQIDAEYEPTKLENNASNKDFRKTYNDNQHFTAKCRPSCDEASEVATEVPMNRLRSATVNSRPVPSSQPVKVVQPVAAPWVGSQLKKVMRANSDVTGSKKVEQEEPLWVSLAQLKRETVRQRLQGGGNMNFDPASTTTADSTAPALPMTAPPVLQHMDIETERHGDYEESSTTNVPLSLVNDRSEKRTNYRPEQRTSTRGQSEIPLWMTNLKLRSKENNSENSVTAIQPTTTEGKENGNPPWHSEWQIKRNTSTTDTDRSTIATSSTEDTAPDFVRVAESMKNRIYDVRL